MDRYLVTDAEALDEISAVLRLQHTCSELQRPAEDILADVAYWIIQTGRSVDPVETA